MPVVYKHDWDRCDCEECRQWRREERAYYDAHGRPDMGPKRVPFEGRLDEIIQQKCDSSQAGDNAR